ncbi:cation diffusion facilitator family transporter [Rhodopila globiformis]|nr:cation diffusion facilitator family transporter [Rhodopila globiformis]
MRRLRRIGYFGLDPCARVCPPPIRRRDTAATGAGMSRDQQRLASRIAWAAIGVNVALSALNLVIAAASGSLAITAEMVHNVVDLAGSAAVLVGVKLSERKSRDFPYGLYKVENVVAVVLSLLVFLTGYEIARDAVLADIAPVRVSGPILGGVVLSAALPFAFSLYVMSVGRQLNSPSLIAVAQEYRTHVLTSGMVLLSLLGHLAGVPLDRYAALFIVVFIGKTGWELLSGAMQVLLDASLDADTLNRVRGIIEADPAVSEVRSLVGRNAGRYRFLEAEVALRVTDLKKAHDVSDRLERAVRARVANVERVMLHYEPRPRCHLCVAVPLASPAGTLSDHFGEAPCFGLVTLRTADGRVERQEVLANPHLDQEKARGIHVAEWLVSLKADTVLLRKDMHGQGPAYVLADAGTQMRVTHAVTLDQALADLGGEVAVGDFLETSGSTPV